jgi:hypothetical protein
MGQYKEIPVQAATVSHCGALSVWENGNYSASYNELKKDLHSLRIRSVLSYWPYCIGSICYRQHNKQLVIMVLQ